jgi:transposase
LLCDALGYPLKLMVTPGQVHDITQAESLLEGERGGYLIADKGYDSRLLVEYVKERGFVPVIPSRSNHLVSREYDKHIYKERNVIERVINKFKQYRRIATRYEKTVVNYVALLHVAACMIWLR